MFFLLPIESPIRDVLQARADHFSVLVMWATVTVAAGVALEGVELVHDAIIWIKRRQMEKKELADLRKVAEIVPVSEVTIKTESTASDHPKWVKVLGRIGLIAVVIGVVAESRNGAKLEDAHNAIHAFDMTLLTEAQRNAGDAAASAKTAHDEADAVKIETDVLTLRLNGASNKVDDIEQDTLAQGPRWRLLKQGKDIFIKALKPFAGQRVTVVICGNEDVERSRFEQLIMNMFREAGWDSPGYARWDGCPNTTLGGNEIFVVASTDDSAEWVDLPDVQWMRVEGGRFNISHDAINELVDVLYKLRIFTMASREKRLPEEIGIQKARQFFGFGIPDGPAEMAYKDPGRIFLLIGPSAPMFVDKSKNPHNKTAAPW